ncbi:hypothetical protein SLEP1_g16074 [Rubroshorea leprosula]|uniref:Uncharacterized protein n=1 Tax=Rubroshorea leprosula TaxID=152421 RepID=A0AAV5IPN7_9ROSI|nr:hypothetical protein SLEP1_g16074 [Rubroshorea leprosula]
MSSEGTQSIVGSEVMPLDYGSMDSESSPSPSSSEKTVEGVRGDEVVEVGGNEVLGVGVDSIPITVVKVEGRRERDYDMNAEIVEEASWGRGESVFCSSRPLDAHIFQLSDSGIKGGSMRDKGWYYFTPRVASKESMSLFTVGRSEEVGEEGGDLLNILDLTSAQCIEAAELYGPSALSEAEMDQFLNTTGGVAILKKPRKKSKTSTKQVDEGRARKEVVPTVSTETEEEVPQLKRKGWEERWALQKKKKVVEEEERADEVPQFVPQPPPVELNPELRQLEEGAEAKNMTGARWFINSTFPEVDRHNTRDEALRYGGASVVKHVLESASWVNGLAQEFMESLRERSLLQRQCDQLQKEKEELEKKNKELQESLNEVVTTVKQLEQERASLSTKLVFEESKRRISESELEAQAQEIRLMKEAFVELKENVKKVKAEYPEVDITKITFGEQEEGVEEDGESMSANFRPQIKLRWEHDANGRAVFPPQFDFEFVAVEEERAEVEEDEVEAGVEGAEVDESQPIPEVEIHPVPSDDEQPPLPDEQQPSQPPPPSEQEPVEPPLPAEK